MSIHKYNIKTESISKYGFKDDLTRGRLFNDDLNGSVSIYEEDRNRIIESNAFRRLEYKTQVFANSVGDHYRTRLTHTLEVAQIARTVSKALRINEDLSECLALVHDIGHPPFGHAGEDGLREAASDYFIFDHNVQTIKVLTYLEQRYIDFNGLNLSFECLDGTLKHNGPMTNVHKSLKTIIENLSINPFIFPLLEAQVASLSDDIAYIAHDIDDGIRSLLFKLEDLMEVKGVYDIFKSISEAHNGINIEHSKLVNEGVRRIKLTMINDLIQNTYKNIKDYNITVYQNIIDSNVMIASFSSEIEEMKNNLKKFLAKNFYKHYRVNRQVSKAKMIICDLFKEFMLNPDSLPTQWFTKIISLDQSQKAEIIVDYIAGMTDRYAIKEHRKLFNLYDYEY